MPRFTVITTNGNAGFTEDFRVHAEGCRDIQKEVAKCWGGKYTYEAESAEALVAQEVAEYQANEQGYTAEHFHICNCAKAAAKAAPDPSTPHGKWEKLKAKASGHLLLMEMGDFLETFANDAETIASVLGLTLTEARSGDVWVPMCGFPKARQDQYLRRLLEQGHRVALAEQVGEPPSGLVKDAEHRLLSTVAVVDRHLPPRK